MMENKALFNQVTTQIIKSTREFFALEDSVATMPEFQRRLFLDQAQTEHYLVAAYLTVQEEPAAGHIVRALSHDRYLMREYKSNVFRVISLAELTFLKRL